MIVVGGDWPADRQRFTLAHEFGHLLFDDILGEGIDPEKAANRFAGAFLVPDESVRCALGEHRSRLELQELFELKIRFGLSIGGWLFRARDLGIIGERHFVSTLKRFRQKGWHKKEPGKRLAPEKPRLFDQLVYRALAEDMISVSKAAELLGTSVADFRKRRRLEAPGAAAHQ